jgi:A/G-specific adenine glycosylase
VALADSRLRPSPATVAHDFAQRLIAWQQRHGRHDLPWQQRSAAVRDAYPVWLSEIMLQQTQVATVIPFYRRFVARFADLPSLAAAPVEDVMALWSGLGYYARARNLHRCAREIVAHHGGHFPHRIEDIAALPGIGRSTAAAIAVFAFGTRAAILDGNVKRVLCRCLGVEGFPGAREVEKRLWALAESLLPASRIEAYTQGLMDLGATLCTRGLADCPRCPLAEDCVARKSGRTAELPTPRPSRALPQRSVGVLLLQEGERVLLELRPPAGIWGGLLAPPEFDGETGDLAAQLARRFDCELESAESMAPLHHGFTHFRLEIRPLRCRVRDRSRAVHEDRLRWLPLADIGRAALPAPVRRLLETL